MCVKKNVSEREAGILCELCEKWFYIRCVKIPEETYNVLGKMTNLHWFCEPCNNGACKLLGNLSRLNERICQVELELNISKTECAKLNEKVERLRN